VRSDPTPFVAMSTAPETPSMSQPVTGAHRCWAEVELGALEVNLRVLRERVPRGVRFMVVLKADAYGHGLASVGRFLAPLAEEFAVANVAEAVALAELVDPRRISILGPALPGERAEIAARGFVPVVSDWEEAVAYAALGRGQEPVCVHFAVDTGMGRIGVWHEEALELGTAVAGLQGLRVVGIGSHLPCADEDDAFTVGQLELFHRLCGELRGGGMGEALIHVANSAGAIGFSRFAGDMVRVGLALYGSSPRAEYEARLRPALSWKTRVTLVRRVGPGRGLSYGRTFVTQGPMRVATLATGYADGYPRSLSGRGSEVLIGGRRCAVLGRVTMDQILADVTDVPEGDSQAGSEAVLIGRQGEEEIRVAEVAAKAGTIAWDVFTGIGQRVKRMHY